MKNMVTEEFYRQYLKDKKRILGITYDEMSVVLGVSSGGVLRKYMDGYRRITDEKFNSFKERIEKYEKKTESESNITDIFSFLRKEKRVCENMFSTEYKELVEIMFVYLEKQALKLTK